MTPNNLRVKKMPVTKLEVQGRKLAKLDCTSKARNPKKRAAEIANKWPFPMIIDGLFCVWRSLVVKYKFQYSYFKINVLNFHQQRTKMKLREIIWIFALGTGSFKTEFNRNHILNYYKYSF